MKRVSIVTAPKQKQGVGPDQDQDSGEEPGHTQQVEVEVQNEFTGEVEFYHADAIILAVPLCALNQGQVICLKASLEARCNKRFGFES